MSIWLLKDYIQKALHRQNLDDREYWVGEARKEAEKIDAENKQLQAKVNRLKKLAEYGRHKADCKPLRPWENECECGYLQALKEPDRENNPTCKVCKYISIPCEWAGDNLPCSAFTPKPQP